MNSSLTTKTPFMMTRSTLTMLAHKVKSLPTFNSIGLQKQQDGLLHAGAPSGDDFRRCVYKYVLLQHAAGRAGTILRPFFLNNYPCTSLQVSP